MPIRKKIVLLLFSIFLIANVEAGLVGWLTSSARSWRFIQQTGGIRISEPVERDGKLVLPVEYDATGITGVTTRPTRVNSGLVVRKVQSNKTSSREIVIRIVTQVAEHDSETGRFHYADLDDFSSGAYNVYYEDAGDPEKFLGRIRVK